MKVLTSDQQPGLQLWHEIAGYALNRIETWQDTRDQIADLPTWMTFREEKRQAVLDGFPPWFFERAHPLNTKVVSRHDFGSFKIENVLFEAFPGWDVNATVYLPAKPGPHPAVVCPTGSSSKKFFNYQRAGQVFARNGFIAVSFDPPGFQGEKQELNGVFDTGFTSTLAGVWSNTYMVLPALRALDYLDSREDVDHAAGYAMSGLSLGGTTTNYCGFMDDRIKFFAPVGCYGSMVRNSIKLRNGSSPASFGHGYLAAGIIHVDMTCLAAPKPCLIIGGVRDVIFDPESMRKEYLRARHIYEVHGRANDIELFIDEEAGHEFTVKMASLVVEKMNLYLRGVTQEAQPLQESGIIDIPHDQLRCHPENRVNIFTRYWDETARLAHERPAKSNPDALRRALGLTDAVTIPQQVTDDPNPATIWYHQFRKINLTLPGPIHVPGLTISRAPGSDRTPALLFIDDQGKWSWMKQGGPLTEAARLLQPERDASEPLVCSIDVAGWGELTLDPTPYSLTAWVNIETHTAYLSNFSAKPIMGLRVRDTLAALAYLKTREDVDPSRIMLGGRGAGAIVALLATLLDEGVAGVVCVDMLSHYGAITSQHPTQWNHDMYIANVLQHFDLPEVFAALVDRSVLVLNPRDAAKEPMSQIDAEELYGIKSQNHMNVRCEMSESDLNSAFVQFTHSI